MKTHFVAVAVGFVIGFITAWVVGLGDPEINKTSVARGVDTLLVATQDTIVLRDTVNIKPKTVYRSRVVKKVDTIYAELEKLKHYEVEKTFSDKAWVNHKFGINDYDVLRVSDWDYKAPPQVIVRQVDTVEIAPAKTKKILKGVGYITAGVVAGLVVRNNN